MLEVKKALYVLPASGNRWHVHLSQTLRDMSFKPTCFDPYVWINGREGGCDYSGTHDDNFLVVSIVPTSIFIKFKETNMIKALGCRNFTLAMTTDRLMWEILLGGSWVP